MANCRQRWLRRSFYWVLIIVLYFSCRTIVVLNTFVNDQVAELPDEYQQALQKQAKPNPTKAFHSNTNLIPKIDIGNYSVEHLKDYKQQKLAHDVLQAAGGCFTIIRPSQVTYKNEHWQSLEEGNIAIFVYSAFHDDRRVVGDLPVVRILAVSVQEPSTLYCHIWYKHLAMPYIVRVNVITSGRGDMFDSIKYDQVLYTCALTTAWPIPTHVSISTAPCRNSSHYLPIIRNTPLMDYKKEFGVCVAIAFGQIPASVFIEWIELHRMFGVSEFNIYNGSVSAQMQKVFKYYMDSDILRVFAMPPPIQNFTKKGVKLASPASLNDCMMRNWYRYRYIIVLDFDEFIVPRKHYNYTHMLSAIDRVNNLKVPSKSYTFRNIYYFNSLPVDASQPKYLKTLRYRTRIETSKFLYAAKSFIDPRTCLSVFNHFCYRRFEPGRTPQTIDVSTDIAASHHYRTCGFGETKCKALMKKTHIDNVTLKFKSELDRRVRDVFNRILTN